MSLDQTAWHETDEAALWVYERLLDCYGPQGWWPGDTPLEVMIGAVLTQATSWRNVEHALANLRSAGALDLAVLLTFDEATLASLIRPAGFFEVKAHRLCALFDHIKREHNGDLTAFLSQDPALLRSTLIAMPGIGPETADSIMLYAAGHRFFVVDAYSRRIWKRLGLAPVADGYDEWQAWFHDRLPNQVALFNEYHALLVRHGKDTCRPQPRCLSCCLKERCAFGMATTISP